MTSEEKIDEGGLEPPQPLEEDDEEWNWNIDDHQAAHESEEHWLLRRQFMEVNKSAYPKTRVLCLSQVFANMEFLGCKYPVETMELVASLSQGIVEEYRQKQKTRIQRTFVKASAAAERKSKGEGPRPHSSTQSPGQAQSQSQSEPRSTMNAYPKPKFRPVQFVRPLPLMQNFVSAGQLVPDQTAKPLVNMPPPKALNKVPPKSQSQVKTPMPPKPQVQSTPSPQIQAPSKKTEKRARQRERKRPTFIFENVKSIVNNILDSSTSSSSSGGGGQGQQKSPQKLTSSGIPALADLHGLVLVEQLYINDTPNQILNRSCSMCHKVSSFSPLPSDKRGFVCSFSIGRFLVEGHGISAEDARRHAVVLALEGLRRVCYTIQIKEPIVGTNEVSKQELTGAAPVPLEQQNNIGSKLLRLMGWSGGALGKNEDGITEAIEASDSVGRKRLGLGSIRKEDVPFNQNKIMGFLRDQLRTATDKDIVFSTEFSSVEREAVHRAASTLGLKSRSYGKNDKRFVVVSRKISLVSLVDEIVKSGETAKYRVIKPGEHENNDLIIET